MSVHSFHPDVHAHGLADDCPRCEEQSHNPLATLDAGMLRMLRERLAQGQSARSTAEARAMVSLSDSAA
jgi:hypothetical protein